MTQAETDWIAELYSPPSEDVDHSALKGIISHCSRMENGVWTTYFKAEYHGGAIMEGSFEDMITDAPYMTAMYINAKKIPHKECKD